MAANHAATACRVFLCVAPTPCRLCFLHVGGSPVQADLIYNLIRRLSKSSGIPVYTFAEDVAASGGYWLL